MRSTGTMAGTLIVTLLVAAAPATPAPATPAPATAQAAPVKAGRPAPQLRTVTLITGDRVTVGADGRPAVERGKGRAGVTFLAHRIDGHQHVVPSDAVALVRQGRLDRRLFDITTLLEFGYDDRRTHLPLIVTHGAGAGARAATTTALGLTVARDLPVVNGVAVRVAKAEATDFWNRLAAGPAAARALPPAVTTVWLDGIRKPTLDVSVPRIGAPVAWQRGYDGSGRKVAVLDTGIDAAHPDLADRVVGAANFVPDDPPEDLVGHGTHVASTIAGSGAAEQGRFTGVAPGARLLDGKVCDRNGDCTDSAVLAGMQWAVEQGAAVVNLSLGGRDEPGVDPLEAAVQRLTDERGVLFVISAGNSGPRNGSVASPASADAALSVGAVSKSDELAEFSSRGPRLGDHALKPELTAPGVDIVAARSKDGSIGTPAGAYTILSGTSMAAPHVAGAAAILSQQHPDWTPAQLKAALMGSASPNPALRAHEQGAGRVDVARAIGQTVLTDPPGLSFGRQLWPHGDDRPLAKTVSYRNHGGTAVTFALALRVLDGAGRPAPAGLFTVSPATVTVPAGGRAEVTVTADTRVGDVDGLIGGELTATAAGGVVVRTPVFVERETEAYDLTLVHKDRAGRPATNYDTLVVREDGRAGRFLEDAAGTETLRLPPGRYKVASRILGTPERPEATMLAQPLVDLTRSQTVQLDARRGKPVKVSVPRPTASPVSVALASIIVGSDFSTWSAILTDRFDGLHSAQVGPDRAGAGFWTTLDVIMAERGPDGTAFNSPFSYHLTWFTKGRMINGFDRRLKHSELATVNAAHAQAAPDVSGAQKLAFAELPGQLGGAGFTSWTRFTLPLNRTEYYNVADGMVWQRVFDEVYFGSVTSRTFARPDPLRKGKTVTERWNRGVFGPSVADPPAADQWAVRRGDTMEFTQPVYADSAGRETFTQFLPVQRIRLFRGGEAVGFWDGTKGSFDIPAGSADYRLEIDAGRQPAVYLSTYVNVAWTFRSGHVAGAAPRRLPLSTVRFDPPLDDRNTAPAGGRFGIPVRVETQPDSGAGTNRSLTVEVSYDQGETWHRARLKTDDGVRTAWVDHPSAPGFVSLRATAADSRGNTVTLTILRAYRTVPPG